jgi:hypothetical protein
VQRLCRSAEPDQILVSSTTAPLLMDRMPPGAGLVEVATHPSAASTTFPGPVYAVARDGVAQMPRDRPAASPPPRPVVAPPASAPPPRRRVSDRLAGLLRDRDELDTAIGVKLQQQSEAERAGQPGPAAKFGEQAAGLTKRLVEVQHEIERLEAEEGRRATG